MNVATAEQVRTEYNVDGAQIYGDYHDLLADDSIDAVSICTPNFLHSQMAIDALEAGKHVMLEKPLAHTLAEGKRLAAAVAAHPRPEIHDRLQQSLSTRQHLAAPTNRRRRARSNLLLQNRLAPQRFPIHTAWLVYPKAIVRWWPLDRSWCPHA